MSRTQLMCAFLLLIVAAVGAQAYEDGYGAILFPVDHPLSQTVFSHSFGKGVNKYHFVCGEGMEEGIRVGSGLYVNYKCPKNYHIRQIKMVNVAKGTNTIKFDYITEVPPQKIGGFQHMFTLHATTNAEEEQRVMVDLRLPRAPFYKILYGQDLRHWDAIATYPRPIAFDGDYGIYRVYFDSTAPYIMVLDTWD